MGKLILKYPVPHGTDVRIEKCVKIIRSALQNGVPTVWAEVASDSIGNEDVTTVRVYNFWTGEDVPTLFVHLNTFELPNGLIEHIYIYKA